MAGYNPYGYGYQPYYQPVPQMQQAGAQMSQPQQMYQSQPQMPAQSAQMPQQQGISPASRPVGNREEANAVPADFSGAPMIFPDFSHGMVYVKRWDMQSGAAIFDDYAIVRTPAADMPAPVMPEYATLEDLRELKSRIAALENRRRPSKKTAESEEAEQHDE